MNSNEQVIKGKIQLSDHSEPDGIFIWLEGFNISTSTDEKGEFELQLPPPELQPGGGLTGEFNLYCYAGNYELQNLSVVVSNGFIQKGQGDIDKDGNISKTITLQKLIDIKTDIQPPEILETDSLRLEITVTLNPRVNAVSVKTCKGSDDWLTTMIFRDIHDPSKNAVLFGSGDTNITEVLRQATEWKMGVNARWLSPRPYLSLEPGVYEVIPYLHVIQDNLPADLIKSIGENADRFHSDYLKIPFKWEPGQLTVKAP